MRRQLPLTAALFACAISAQQPGPTARQLAEMTVSIADVRIGADEHGRSELCGKLRTIRENDGFPVTPAAKGEALAVACQGRPAGVLVLQLEQVADPKRALCEYAAAPAGLAYERIDWITVRRGGLPLTGAEIRNRLEPLGVRTFAALLYAFGFASIQAGEVRAPLHQIDGFCAAG